MEKKILYNRKTKNLEPPKIVNVYNLGGLLTYKESSRELTYKSTNHTQLFELSEWETLNNEYEELKLKSEILKSLK